MVRHVLLVVLLGAAVAAAQHLGWLTAPALLVQDAQMRWTPRAPTGTVVVVDIDAKSIDAIGQWPWPRSVHAALVDSLSALGAGCAAGVLPAVRAYRVDVASALARGQ